MNFNLTTYLEYVNSVKSGIRAAERQYNLDFHLKLRGPAGIFKQESKHVLCFGLLESCNKNIRKCPIDIITFHRKGTGVNAAEIYEGGFDIKNKIQEMFSSLRKFEMANR